MTSHSIAAERIAFATAGEPEKELFPARLVLMVELEASLQASRKALLALDLANIECETKHQSDLIQRLNELGQQGITSMAAERSAEPGALCRQYSLPELERELGQSRNRILDALRLQAALLLRARGKLRILGNMLAGPTTPYGPLLAGDGALARWNWKQREEI